VSTVAALTLLELALSRRKRDAERPTSTWARTHVAYRGERGARHRPAARPAPLPATRRSQMLLRAAGRLSLPGGRLTAARAMGAPKRVAVAPPADGSNKRGKVDAAAAAADGAPADGAPADGAPAAAAAAARAPPAALRAAQAAEMAALRATSERNTAAARAVAAAAEAAGAPPALCALLAEPSWRALLDDRLAAPAFAELEAFVTEEWAGPAPIFPPKPLVFRALNSCPVDKVRGNDRGRVAEQSTDPPDQSATRPRTTLKL
jgi:hypothetical protein